MSERNDQDGVVEPRISGQSWLVPILLALAIPAVLVLGFRLTEGYGLQVRRELVLINERTLDVLAESLQGDLTGLRQAAANLAGSPMIHSLLVRSGIQNLEAANQTLDRYNHSFQSSVCYVMDLDGITIASSNRDSPDSFLGEDYSFRPYFQSAAVGTPGEYFAVGITSRKRGFYASHPVTDLKGEVIGVVVIKRDVDELQQRLCRGDPCFFLDRNGVVFFSSQPDLSLRNLWPLPELTRDALLASRQFGGLAFSPILPQRPLPGAEIYLNGQQYMIGRHQFNDAGWQILLFSSLGDWVAYRRLGLALTLLIALGMTGILVDQILRRKRRIEQLQANHELRRYRDRLEKLVEARTKELEARNAELERFTYTVSHDLKAPLITISGYSGMLEQDLEAGDLNRIRDDAHRITSAAESMRVMLDQLLELSRIGRVVNPSEDVELLALVQEAAQQFGHQLEERRIHLEVDPNLPVVHGDRTRLREVIDNLTSNAIKYMGIQSHPRIEIGVLRTRGDPICYVRDNGIGIDPAYHDKIFNLFECVDGNAGGTGIGLAIVKRIIEYHNGRIWVESEGLGKGSTLCFTLPLGKNVDGTAPVPTITSPI